MDMTKVRRGSRVVLEMFGLDTPGLNRGDTAKVVQVSHDFLVVTPTNPQMFFYPYEMIDEWFFGGLMLVDEGLTETEVFEIEAYERKMDEEYAYYNQKWEEWANTDQFKDPSYWGCHY